MKIKEIFYLLGFKPKARTYGFEIKDFDVGGYGRVEYAQWLHPRESPKSFDAEKMDALRAFLRPGDVAIDIGAHTGDTAVPMALAVGREGCVLALEPNKYVYPILEKNAALNPDKTRILPLMFAATPEDCTMEFEYSDSGFCNGGFHEGLGKWSHAHAFSLEVRGKNLERFLREKHADLVPKIRYIKIDTEGYDCSVIKSISGIIRECKPHLTVEVFKMLTKAQRVDLFRTITSFGYEVYKAGIGGCSPGVRIGEENLQDWKHYDVFCVPVESGS